MLVRSTDPNPLAITGVLDMGVSNPFGVRRAAHSRSA
jgi:hypothetical protein